MSLKDIQKLYEKFGKKFGISVLPQAGIEDYIFFSSDEWLWIKEQNLSQEQFDYLWNAKKDDYRAQIIPDQDQLKGKTLADQFVPDIRKELAEKIKQRAKEDKWAKKEKDEDYAIPL